MTGMPTKQSSSERGSDVGKGPDGLRGDPDLGGGVGDDRVQDRGPDGPAVLNHRTECLPVGGEAPGMVAAARSEFTWPGCSAPSVDRVVEGVLE